MDSYINVKVEVIDECEMNNGRFFLIVRIKRNKESVNHRVVSDLFIRNRMKRIATNRGIGEEEFTEDIEGEKSVRRGEDAGFFVDQGRRLVHRRL